MEVDPPTSLMGRVGSLLMSPFRMFSPKPKGMGDRDVPAVAKLGDLDDVATRNARADIGTLAAAAARQRQAASAGPISKPESFSGK